MSTRLLTGRVFLVLRKKKIGGYSDDAFVVAALAKHPTRGQVAADEYVLPLILRVPESCFSQVADWSTIEAKEVPPQVTT